MVLPETKPYRRARINRHTLLLTLVLLYAAGFRLLALDRPFHADAEGSGSMYGVLARNYLRFDLAHTHGMPVLTVGQPPLANRLVFYPDHPPLVPLLIVPFYAAFGVGEWQTRLPFSIVTVMAIYALYLLSARWATPRVALMAATLFAATPMTLYFGGFPEVVGMPLILLVLLAVFGYLRFHRRPSLVTFVPFVAAFTLAGLCDWPAYLVVPVLLTHFVMTQPRRQWPWMMAFGAMAAVLFVGVYAYISLATHLPWNWMVPLLRRRSAVVGVNPFTLSQWLGAAAVYNRTYHTLPLLAASGLWLVVFGFRRRHPPPGTTAARILMAVGILHVVVGGKAVYDHAWWWSPLTPGIVLSAALVVEWVLQFGRRQGYPNAGGRIVAVGLVLFAAWTGFTTYRQLYPVTRDVPFTPMELGQAIRVAAPDPNDLALIVGGEGAAAQLWFYGDRALRTRVWSPQDFERRLHDETADLVFDFDVQSWSAAATGIVFPRVWGQDFGTLRSYLTERYPSASLPPVLAEKFEVFDLR